MTSMVKRRILPIALVVVALGLFGVGCGDDGNSDGTAASGSAPGAGRAGVPQDPSTESVSDEDFDAQMGALHADIESAGDDVCALSKALGSLPPDPANAEQAEQYAQTYVLMLHNIAKVLGPETEAGAPVEDAANKFAARAEELGYSPSFIEDDALFDIMNAEPVSLGLVQFGQLAASCPDATG